MRRSISVLFVGACAFLGGFAVNLLPRTTPHASAQLSVPGRPVSSSTDPVRGGDRFEKVAQQVSPAVVAVDSVRATAPRKEGDRSRSVEESGSGVLVRFDGQRDPFVVTNNHVIEGAASKDITVSLADGRLFKPDRVWADAESDIALLRLAGADNVPAATLGDSDRTRVGQWVLAVGSPFGLSQTVTHGIVSARERGQVSLGGTIRIKEFLQTDAAINPGSSGGPLFNLDGEVIGINTAIASHSNSSSGVAFSIPINLVKRVAKELFDRGTVSRGYLGVQLAGSYEANDALRLGLDRLQGTMIETVYAGTPAATAGLKAGDVILQVDGTTIRHENHFINHVSALAPGRKIRLQVWRERRALTLDAVVGDWGKGQEQLR